MGMITFDEFDTALVDAGITAVFPKRDIVSKQVYLGDNKDKIKGMSYFISPYGMKERYYIGFLKDEGTPYVLWNGKMHNIVFEVDDHTGSISYMTPNSEVCYETNVLTLAQIKTIGEALVKYLTSNKEEKDNNELEETKQRDDIKITFEQLSKIFREQLEILFPGKHISSNEAKSKDMDSYEMQFHIVVKPGEPHLIIGFTKEAGSSMVDIWNGKRMNKVIDIDIDDGFIRRYHEPQLYAESSNCLQKGGVPATPSGTATLLRLSPKIGRAHV